MTNQYYPTTDVDRIVVETGDTRVDVTKVRTPTGERIQIEHDDLGQIRLDAVELEALTWQDEAFFADLVDGEYDYRNVDPRPKSAADLQVSNEYALARLRGSDDGAGVSLTAPKMGYGIGIDARVLAAVVTRPKTFFSELLRTPYGPDDDDDVHVF
ncbi:hypothetical protein EA462_16310 [Natrarchaeobius halalkaliphilus]|uniref:Uncharacterized protein n=1 Tax=Natrarchaeobius halalkaliphilus TaxID=1679091 RepID=A0A3N6LYB3_9EURY|nr:hypothetical protein [Natrarchaeobius halalkaliphilus]RQG86702.1 hypothetical protein EA462_16310 [Natrarchaeobius halalkaliphilus]